MALDDLAVLATLISSIATLVLVFLAYRALRVDVVRLQKDSERSRVEDQEKTYFEYTARYLDILGRMPSSFFATEANGTSDISASEEVRRVVHQYVVLCSEEVKLRIRHQVEDLVWQDWEQGIKAGLEIHQINSIWEGLATDQDYRVLRAFLTKGIEAATREYLHPGSLAS